MDQKIKMPYKFQIEKMKIKREDDRRVKHTLEEYEEAIAMVMSGVSQREVARETGISRRMISFLLHPDRLKRCRELHDSSKYYEGGKKWAKTMREHRAHKQELFKKGKLI